ncbi:hypothetical protein CRUP_029049 [Coryphaenoides rupestris]|nr:hypothetical protein CRUP_029049 [Coryphaenoides rupestris]
MSQTRLTEHLFNLKFAAKELQRNSKRCDKEEKAEKTKVKKAIQKGNVEVARIHAENAIRQKNQSINLLRMSARVDAVAARVQTAVTMNQVTKSMAGVVKSMDATLKSMNLEKNQVDTLMHEMADEAGLDLTMELPQSQTGSLAATVASSEQARLSCTSLP